MEDILIKLGKRIADLRIKKGLTQEQLAELINYSTNHIAKLETAKTNPSFELLVNIAKCLNVELKDLFNFSEYKSIKYIKNEFKNLINTSDEKQLQLMYKIFNSLIK